MMSLLASATLALGFFASTTFASDYTNADVTTTETQEIGSTTSEGAIWYSMNICEIVQHTQCDTSLSEGGAAPPEETGGEGNYPPPPPGDEPQPSESATGEPSYSPPAPSNEPAPTTDNGDGPPLTEGSGGTEPAPTEGGGSDEPLPSAITTTNDDGEETTISGTFVPTATDEDATGSPTEESSTQSSSTGGALALVPAAAPAALYGVMALFLVGI